MAPLLIKSSHIPIPPVLSSVRHIVVKDRVYAHRIDLSSSTVEYRRHSKSAVSYLRDWSRPAITYKTAFAASLMAPRYFISDILKKTQLCSEGKVTTLVDKQFADLFPHVVELSNFIDDDGVIRQAFTCAGLDGLTSDG